METVSNNCTICTENFNARDRLKTRLPCSHSVCRSCVFDLCKTKMSCPFCREDFQIAIQKLDTSTKNNYMNKYWLIINNKLVPVSLNLIIFYLVIGLLGLILPAANN